MPYALCVAFSSCNVERVASRSVILVCEKWGAHNYANLARSCLDHIKISPIASTRQAARRGSKVFP